MNEFKLVSVTIDVMNIGSIGSVGSFKEFDNVIIRATMLNSRQPIDLAGKKVRMYAKKPNGSIVYQEKNITIINPRGGIIDISLSSGLLNVIGTVSFELEIINADETFVTSGTVSYSVVDKLNDLDNEIEEVQDIEFLEQAKEFNAYIVPEETKRVITEKERVSNEEERVSDEIIRISNEEERISNEVDRLERFAVMEDKVNTVISSGDIDTIISNALK